MENKKQHAKELYYQSSLNKSEIATILGISRRSLHYWVKEGNWDRLKESAEHLPTLLAEKCYHIFAHLADKHLDECSFSSPVTLREAETLYKLTQTIQKLKNHSTINEGMELFAHFAEKLKKYDPVLARSLAPHLEMYFAFRADVTVSTFMPDNFNELGRLPHKPTHSGPSEKSLDYKDFDAWDQELAAKGYITEDPENTNSGDRKNIHP